MPHAETRRQNILVVKLGAFGNIILSLAAFAAIRQHHADARISVLTSQTYADWLGTFPYFDDVLVDPRPRWWDFPNLRRLGRMLADGHFSRVYDLQTSVTVVALLSSVSGQAPPGMVWDRLWLRAAGP